MHGCIPAKLEGIPQVMHATAPVEVSLRHRVANALESLAKCKLTLSCQRTTEHFCLVELTLASAQRVQGHGHDRIKRAALQSRVAETLLEKIAQKVADPKLTIIFELMDEVAQNSARLHDGHGAHEVEGSSPAVRTNERVKRP